MTWDRGVGSEMGGGTAAGDLSQAGDQCAGSCFRASVLVATIHRSLKQALDPET